MKKAQITILLVASAIYLFFRFAIPAAEQAHYFEKAQTSSTDAMIEKAFQERTSDLQVEGSGTVVKILPDDNEGSRHQRFILQLDSGLTLLVAHNIDIAARLQPLAEEDRVDFFGEYEWTEKGGVLHWTHEDPSGRHVAGWLRKGRN